MSEPLQPESLQRIGRYPVRRYIAGGGMSWIFEVVDPDLFDARRALKLLKPGQTDRETLRRFRREAELLSRIQHPNLIHIYEFGEDPGTGCSFYTMDFIEGRNLAQIHGDWLRGAAVRGAPADARSLEQIVRYFVEVLSALSRLHAANVVHRDIKPQNVFVDAQDRAVLGDLGIAKSSSAAGETQTGEMPGTPLYMAPEQSLSLEISTRTDLFSLGLSLYRVLTGRTVYDAALGSESTNSLKVLRHLWNLQGAAREFEFVFPPEVPEALQAAIRRACRMNPEQRFASAEQMSEALSSALRPRAAAPAGAVTPRVSRRPRPALVAALGATLIVAGIALWFGLGSRGDRSAALARRSDAEAAHALAVSVLAQLEGRSGSDALAALEDARKRVAYTEKEQGDGERELAEGSFNLAERQFARALEGYTRACQDLVDHWLRGAADAALHGSNATPAAAPIDASVPQGCAAADAERARLLAAESAQPAKAPGTATAAVVVPAAPQSDATATATDAAATAAPKTAKPPVATRPALPDRTEQKRAIGATLVTWNRAMNARDWALLQAVQKLKPGQLESYQRSLASKDIRQKLTIRWIAELSPTRFETEVQIVREERNFFIWREVGKENRQAIAVLEGGNWKLTGL